MKWDTSSLPDNAVISGCSFTHTVNGLSDTISPKNFIGEWFNWGASCDATDWSDNACTANAFTVALASETTAGNTDTHTASNCAANISLTGTTFLRTCIDGGVLSTNQVHQDEYGGVGTSRAGPCLNVTYSVPGSTFTPTATFTVTAPPTATPTVTRTATPTMTSASAICGSTTPPAFDSGPNFANIVVGSSPCTCASAGGCTVTILNPYIAIAAGNVRCAAGTVTGLPTGTFTEPNTTNCLTASTAATMGFMALPVAGTCTIANGVAIYCVCNTDSNTLTYGLSSNTGNASVISTTFPITYPAIPSPLDVGPGEGTYACYANITNLP